MIFSTKCNRKFLSGVRLACIDGGREKCNGMENWEMPNELGLWVENIKLK